jgi:hypothetical protein
MLRTLIVFFGIAIVASSTTSALAQNRGIGIEAKRQYDYAPELPGGIRGAIYRETTGHNGRFYNCDGEENKRCSPYIDWSTNCHREWLPTWGSVIRQDICEVKQRVRSGSCRDGHCEESSQGTFQFVEPTFAIPSFAKSKSEPSTTRSKSFWQPTAVVKNQAAASKSPDESSDASATATTAMDSSTERTASSLSERLFKVR